jgi:hypothetical protein
MTISQKGTTTETSAQLESNFSAFCDGVGLTCDIRIADNPAVKLQTKDDGSVIANDDDYMRAIITKIDKNLQFELTVDWLYGKIEVNYLNISTHYDISEERKKLTSYDDLKLAIFTLVGADVADANISIVGVKIDKSEILITDLSGLDTLLATDGTMY